MVLVRHAFQHTVYASYQDNGSTVKLGHAVGVNFLGILALGYLIAVLSQFDTAVMLLGIDALLAVIIMMNLSNALFRFGNNKNAIQFWLITAGYEVIAVFIIAATIFALG